MGIIHSCGRRADNTATATPPVTETTPVANKAGKFTDLELQNFQNTLKAIAMGVYTPEHVEQMCQEMKQDSHSESVQKMLHTIAMTVMVAEELEQVFQEANMARLELENLAEKFQLPRLMDKIPPPLTLTQLDYQELIKGDLFGSWAFAQLSINAENKEMIRSFDEKMNDITTFIMGIM
jgi:hypothetical protein